MSGTFKIKFYSDPGHGWGAVKRNVLIEHGVIDKISRFSYQKGATVYLEEDGDLGTLVTTLATKGITIQYEEKTSDNRSPIRSYDSFKV